MNTMQDYYYFRGEDGEVDIYCKHCNEHIRTVQYAHFDIKNAQKYWRKHDYKWCSHDWYKEYVEILQDRIERIINQELDIVESAKTRHFMTEDTLVELKNLYGRYKANYLIGFVFRELGFVTFKNKTEFDSFIHNAMFNVEKDEIDLKSDGLYMTAYRYTEQYL